MVISSVAVGEPLTPSKLGGQVWGLNTPIGSLNKVSILDIYVGQVQVGQLAGSRVAAELRRPQHHQMGHKK